MFLNDFEKLMLFNTDDGGGSGGDPQGGEGDSGEGGQDDFNFDGFWAGLGENDRKGLEDHWNGQREQATGKLKSALDSERDNRKQLEKDLKQLKKSAGDNEALQAEIARMQTDLDARDRVANFYRDIPTDVIDRDLARILVESNEDAFTNRDGSIRWDAIREQKPHLFQPEDAKRQPGVDGGRGNGKPPGKSGRQKSNSVLRSALG